MGREEEGFYIEKYKRNAQMRQKEMTETHYHISKPTACFMLDLNDLKCTKTKSGRKKNRRQKKNKRRNKKRRRNEIRTFLLRFLHAFYREIIF